MPRTFPLAVILSVQRNRLLVPIDDYRAYLDYLVGERVPLWDVGRTRGVVAAALARGQLRRWTKTIDGLHPPEKTDSGAGARYLKASARALGWGELTIAPVAVDYEVRTLAEAIR